MEEEMGCIQFFVEIIVWVVGLILAVVLGIIAAVGLAAAGLVVLVIGLVLAILLAPVWLLLLLLL
jgi:hypothetical protein